MSVMRKHVPEEIGVKAAGEIRTVDQVLAAIEAGASRIGTSGHDRDSGRLEAAVAATQPSETAGN